MNVDTVRPNEKIAEESEQIGRDEVREKIRSCGGKRKMKSSTRVGAQRRGRVRSYNFINYRTQSQHVCDMRLAQAENIYYTVADIQEIERSQERRIQGRARNGEIKRVRKIIRKDKKPGIRNDAVTIEAIASRRGETKGENEDNSINGEINLMQEVSEPNIYIYICGIRKAKMLRNKIN